ncbi:MAG: hypothetical protein F4X44_13420 [Gammaproteobacteria bacterium]|nr:hypothetical protein [Gammaproteobacteria bacterium]
MTGIHLLQRLLTASFVALISVATGSSLADSCIDYSLKENFERMDVVFTGTVKAKQNASKKVSRKIDWGPGFSGQTAPVLEVRFKVHEEWKGELGKHVDVYTINPRKSSIGYDFKKDEKYVVFARFNNPENHVERRENTMKLIWTSWCFQNLELGSESRKRKQSSDRLRAFLLEMNSSEQVHTEKNPFIRGVDDNKKLFGQLSELKSNAESTDSTAKQDVIHRDQ